MPVRAKLVRAALHEKKERLHRGPVSRVLRQRRVREHAVYDGWLHLHMQSGQCPERGENAFR